MSRDVRDVLGMRLEDALAYYRALGVDAPAVVRSDSPRGERSEGTLRVVRVRPCQLTVCAFMDGLPQ